MRTISTVPRHPVRTSDPATWLSRAWLSVALTPVFFFVAFAVGEGIISGLGYTSGGSLPLRVTLLSDIGAVGAFLIPCVTAVWFGSKARRAGVHRAVVPMAIGIALGIGVLLLTIISELGNPV